MHLGIAVSGDNKNRWRQDVTAAGQATRVCRLVQDVFQVTRELDGCKRQGEQAQFSARRKEAQLAVSWMWAVSAVAKQQVFVEGCCANPFSQRPLRCLQMCKQSLTLANGTANVGPESDLKWDLSDSKLFSFHNVFRFLTCVSPSYINLQ